MKLRFRRGFIAMIAIASVAVAAGCGGSSGGGSSSGSSGGSSTPAASHKGGTFTILANTSFGVADPAQNYTLQEWQLLINTHDGLVQFKRVGGVPGTQIVPDLATSIPTPTDGGKTYTFQIRKGIKFSNGTVMKPSDFVTTFERQFTVPGPTSFYSGIVGASRVQAARHCDLSQGVVADDSAYTLTIHLTAPDPEFLDQLALPFAYVVPGNTSKKITGNNVPPGTGPYMWKSYDPNKEAVLVRNPFFKVWNADAQPAGYPDEIVEKYGLQISDEVTQVERGAADEVFDGDVIPADRLNELNGAQYKNQVHVNPLTADWYMALNTTTPPFNNLKARQAINFAADRNAYRQDRRRLRSWRSRRARSCRRTSRATSRTARTRPARDTTKWTGTDIAKAKQLVQESGTAGMKVVVNSANDQTSKALGEQMVSDLNKIGYKASGQYLAGSIQYPYVSELEEPQQVERRLVGLVPGLPGAVRLPERAARLRLDPPEQRRQPEHRGLLRQEDPGADDPGRERRASPTRTRPTRIWQKVDHEMTDQAPWVDLFNPKQIDFLSKRVGNYQWNPQWYILIDQLWVK